MTIRYAWLVLLPALSGLPAIALAQDWETIYRFRIVLEERGEPVMAASWLGVEGRTATIRQTYEAPYQTDYALSPQGSDADGAFGGELTLTVRPIRYDGELCLDVDLASHAAGEIHHYRSDDLLEIHPSTDSFSASGFFCASRADGDGVHYSLNLAPDDETIATIVMTPVTRRMQDFKRLRQ